MEKIELETELAIIDTHLHVIDQRKLTYTWLSGYPQLSGNYLYETYASEARYLGITAALQMEVDVPRNQIELEANMAESLRRECWPPVAGAVSSCRPEHKDFPQFLERQTAKPWIKGFRRVLHVVPDDISWGPIFRTNLRRLAPLGLPFDLCLFRTQLSIAIELAKACPDTQFVLDHCGQPNFREESWDRWKHDINEIAKQSNVALKISGLPAYTGHKTIDTEVLRPCIEHCIIHLVDDNDVDLFVTNFI